MRTVINSILSLILASGGMSVSAQVWSPDNGDGTYTNPVLYADYSDPDVCAVGEDYYLTASSFNCIPGLPILHSKDLVNWSTGWPMMGDNGKPYTQFRKPKSSSTLIVNPQESDEFNDGQLGLQWQWHANYDQKFGMPTADGTMRLYTYDLPADFRSLWDIPNLLLQKPTAPCFTVTAKVRFAYSTDGKCYKETGESFTMREGKWIGAKFGFVSECRDRKANRGWLDIDWVRITK